MYKKYCQIIVPSALFFACIANATAAMERLTDTSAAALSETITIENLVSHLKAFQEHADENRDEFPGTRFTLSAGYDASRDYLIKTLQEAGYRVSVQDVPFDISYIAAPAIFAQQRPAEKAFIENKDYSPFLSSGEATLTAPVSVPTGDKFGCKAGDFTGFTPGNIALIQRGGSCTYAERVLHAQKAGATGVIIYNNVPGVMFVSLGASIHSETTPVVLVSEEVGKSFLADLKHGTPPVVHFDFHSVKKSGFSQNIFAESTEGDPNHIVMAGAHLDSAWGNAGINDNGSAVAAVLETALQLKNTKPVNKIRFAFWTGEELGLTGSEFYVAHLNPTDKANIALYLNYEILGAPNGARFIMGTNKGDPPGTDKIIRLYVDYFKAQGLKSLVIDPSMSNASARSDMHAFMQAGIPSGFIVTGAEFPWNAILKSIFSDLPDRKTGQATHPCYHKACDRLTLENGLLSDSNFDFDLYLQMARAAAYAMASYAMQPMAYVN